MANLIEQAMLSSNQSISGLINDQINLDYSHQQIASDGTIRVNDGKIEIAEDKIKKFNDKVKEVEIIVNPQDINNVVGYKKENIEKLKEMYNVDVVLKQDIKHNPGKIDVIIKKKFKDFIDDNE